MSLRHPRTSFWCTSAYVSIRKQTSSYVSIRVRVRHPRTSRRKQKEKLLSQHETTHVRTNVGYIRECFARFLFCLITKYSTIPTLNTAVGKNKNDQSPKTPMTTYVI